MQENRKVYRKKFTSTGVIYLAGELLEFVSYDVSVKGIQIELHPGQFISSVSDMRNLLKENEAAEVFVHDLGLSAEAKIAWTLEAEGKMLLGLEFIEVMHNATKLWKKRRYYRKAVAVNASILHNKQEINAITVDVSMDGVRLKCTAIDSLKVGDVIKLFVQENNIKALAVIIWMNSEEPSVEFGVRYISIA